ncbi:MAG: glycosyltransferase family 4 protein [Gammaproteobacteria bacterium]
MKILFTNTGAWGTGSFTAIDAIAKELLKLGHQVKIFFPDMDIDSPDKKHYYSHPDLYAIWRFPIKNHDTQLSVFPLMIPDPNPRVTDIVTFKELTQKQLQLYMDDFSVNIQKVIDEFKPDIIESQHVWLMGYLLNKLGYKYFIGAHMSDQIAFQYDHKMQPIAMATAQNAEKIFAVSKYVKHQLISLYKIPEDKIVITYNGYDENVFYPQRLSREEVLQEFELDLPKDANIITFAGKISKTKGIDILIKAAQIIDNKYHAHFLIFGSGEIKDDYLKVPNVHFLGHHSPEKLANAHNIAKLCAAPSREEGFGISSLEAMACGLPVIVCENTGAEEFVVGEIVAQEDPKALADAVIKILSIPVGEYNNLSRRAITQALEFSWEHIAQQRLACYELSRR